MLGIVVDTIQLPISDAIRSNTLSPSYLPSRPLVQIPHLRRSPPTTTCWMKLRSEVHDCLRFGLFDISPSSVAYLVYRMLIYEDLRANATLWGRSCRSVATAVTLAPRRARLVGTILVCP